MCIVFLRRDSGSKSARAVEFPGFDLSYCQYHVGTFESQNATKVMVYLKIEFASQRNHN